MRAHVGSMMLGAKMEETISSVRATLAANLVALRAQRGWSQEELSFQSGLDRSFIAHVERKARNVSLGSLEKLARAFDLPTHTLLVPRAGEQQPTP